MFAVAQQSGSTFVSGATALFSRLVNGVTRVPIYMWIYLAVIGYIYKRMLRDFLGIGTKRVLIIGRITLSLTKEEEQLSASVIDPSHLTDTFASVGGLDDVKSALTESVLWPYKHTDLLQSAGVSAALPTGVLLYGLPGTGKTLLARALAKELGCYFIEVSIESLFSKYVGESEKLAAAVFSLAHKLKDCVIFIDEIDALLSSRQNETGETAVYTHAKTIFMTKWDGLVSATSAAPRQAGMAAPKILVLGATNRMEALDDAILRRLSIRLNVPLPCPVSRKQILEIHLAGINAVLRPSASTVAPPASNAHDAATLERIVAATSNYSGSDLRELCKAAMMASFRGTVAALQQQQQQQRQVKASTPGDDQSTVPNPTSVSLDWSHFEIALKRVKPSACVENEMASQAGAFEAVARQLRRSAKNGNGAKT